MKFSRTTAALTQDNRTTAAHTQDNRMNAALTQDNIRSLIRRFNERVTKGDNSKEEQMLRFEPFNDMDKHLLIAPFTVQTLATLCLIAAETKM